MTDADKGAALRRMRTELGAAGTVYLGDDVTDEDAFTRMRRPADLTVKVGTGSTAARYRVDDEPAAAALLQRLWQLCSATRVAR